MGKATIVSGGDGGKYVIKLDYGKEAKEKRLAQYTARLAELTALIDTQQGKIDTQQGKIDEANAKLKAAQDAVIAAHQAMTAPGADQGAATKATTAAIKAWAKAAVALEAENRKMAPLKLEMQLLKDEQAQLKKDKDKWEALQLEEKKEAWCADLTEDATGEVATIEIPGEDLLVLIAPEAKPPVATDGILTAREVQSASQVFFNAAILPGWQRWTPTYRRGVINKINDDETVNVTLTNDRSSAQNLVINRAPELFGVPVKYMTCDVSAFDAGDACVIKFTDHDWDKPAVVGFVDNPKLCSALHGIQASETHYGGSAVEEPSSLWAVAYGKDMPEEPKPVSVYADHPGHITWSSPHFKLGSSRVELSWRGPDDRYSRITSWTNHTGGEISWMPQGFFIEKIGAPKGSAGSIPGANCYIDTGFVWINGRRVGATVEKVIAAALHRPNPDEPGGVVLRVLSDSYPQRTGTRRFCTFDLIPSDASGPVPLSAIIAATSFKIHATWPAMWFHPALPEAGSWYNEQRPHFDNRGERVATSIIKHGEQTRSQVHAVSLDPVTWQILEEFSPLGQNTDERTSSAEVTGTHTTILYPSGFELVRIASVSFEISRTYNGNYYVLYAVDFLNDDFVYVYHEMQSSGSEYESGAGSITGGVTGGVYSGEDTYSKSNTIALTINHSIHGVIAQRTHTSTETGGVGIDGENATISSTTNTEFIWDNTQLCADLSRDVFAIGVPRPNKYEINYSGPAGIIDNRHSDKLKATVNVTTTKSQIEYSVFMGGAAVASGTNGDYDMPPNPDVSKTTVISDVYPTGMMMVLNNNVSLPHSYNITEPTYLQSSGTINARNEACKNIAVRADGKAAYFGVNARDVGGLELLVVNSKDGTETAIKEVPPYIDGTHPTIACPVFGSRRK